MKKNLVFLLIGILFQNYIFADEISVITNIFKQFKEEKLENHPLISLWYGTTWNDNSLLANSEQFAPSFNLGIEYGFLRIKKDLQTEPYSLYFGERIYFENQSSHLKPKNWKHKGQTIDGWIFGLKAINGLGLDLGTNLNFFKHIKFQQNLSLIWMRFDFENYYRNIINNPNLQIYDETYKFGRNFGKTMEIEFTENFSLGISNEYLYAYTEFNFWKWVTAYSAEIMLQKWMDTAEDYFVDTYGSDYYLLKFIYKIIVNEAIFALIKHNEYLFSPSNTGFHNSSFLIKITYKG